MEFCNGEKINPFTPTVKQLLEYFHYHAEVLGTSAYSLSMARQNIKWVIDASHHHVLEDVMITRYLKGLFNDKPPKITKDPEIWDIHQVLHMFRDWPDNGLLSLGDLTKKLIMLLLHSTSRCKSELPGLSLDHFRVYPTKYVFELTLLPKTFSLARRLNALRLFPVEELPDSPEICPLLALKEYIDKTEKIRTTSDLLVTTTPNF